jgi:anaerobic magnesium-protoporphyrin IX monomethyl ester cyclase
MRVALVNPNWTFDGSIYFGCREPHLPLELGYARALLQGHGHEARMFDCHLFDIKPEDLAQELRDFAPEMIVATTAPTYLFWRCPPPELRVPQEVFRALASLNAITIAVGPHGSATPRAVIEKLGIDGVVMGECEEALVQLAGSSAPGAIPGIAWRDGEGVRVNGGPRAAAFTSAPALVWPDAWVARHDHHHHRFDTAPVGPGAEVEASRGCPYRCTFCAKENFRDLYRRRALPALLAEIDGLLAQGVRYLYFIDEIFLPNRPLLLALAERDVVFGVQTRLDLWKPEMLELLGRAGCVSIEAGVESLSVQGRALLAKDCRVDTDTLTDRLIYAKQFVPFVQGNLIGLPGDDAATIRGWRDKLRDHGVWANDPVPLFPYPGSPEYRKLFGVADDQAWERAHHHYLTAFSRMSELQDTRPQPLWELELAPPHASRGSHQERSETPSGQPSGRP